MAAHPALRKLTLDDLHREIRSRQRRRPSLERRRAKVAAKLEALDAEIAALTEVVLPVKRKGSRQAQDESLRAYLRRALSGNTMRSAEAAKAVRMLGYKTTSPYFYKMVSAALARKNSGFKRVSRGRYTAA
jgi:hypothetical protein